MDQVTLRHRGLCAQIRLQALHTRMRGSSERLRIQVERQRASLRMRVGEAPRQGRCARAILGEHARIATMQAQQERQLRRWILHTHFIELVTIHRVSPSTLWPE